MDFETAQIASILFALFIIGIFWYFVRSWAKSFRNIREIEESQQEILQSLEEIKATLKKLEQRQ